MGARGNSVSGGRCAVPDAFRVLRLMGLSHMFRAELETAHGIAERLAEMAAGSSDPALTMEAHRALGGTCLELGRLTERAGTPRKRPRVSMRHDHHAATWDSPGTTPRW